MQVQFTYPHPHDDDAVLHVTADVTENYHADIEEVKTEAGEDFDITGIRIPSLYREGITYTLEELLKDEAASVAEQHERERKERADYDRERAAEWRYEAMREERVNGLMCGRG